MTSYVHTYILSNSLGHFGEGSVFCEYYDYKVIIDYLHIFFHGNFVESEDFAVTCIIVVIYSSKRVSILYLSIYSVQSTLLIYLIFPT